MIAFRSYRYAMMYTLRLHHAAIKACLLIAVGFSFAQGTASATTIAAPVVQRPHLLFIGNSFTYSEYEPVRSYNAQNVKDEIADQRRMRSRGGIPGIIERFAAEQGEKPDIYMVAIGLATLQESTLAARRVIRARQWDAVFLQGHSKQGFDLFNTARTCQNMSERATELVCGVDDAIARVHAHASHAKIYLIETPVSPDVVVRLHSSVGNLVNRSHDAFAFVARENPGIAAVAPVGDAFFEAQESGVATFMFPNDNLKQRPWYVMKFERFTAKLAAYFAPVVHRAMPATIAADAHAPTNNFLGPIQLFADDDHHMSTAGSYLAALVEYAVFAHTDPRSLGVNDAAAHDLGIPVRVAVELQSVAASAVLRSEHHNGHANLQKL